MSRVPVKPELIRWARERSGLTREFLTNQFSKYPEWENGTNWPTLKQLEKFAKATWTPLGYFFLPEPPEEKLPVPDFRTLTDAKVKRPSPNLIETIETMQRRQEWMREFLIEEGCEPLAFVGTVKVQDDPVEVAARMRQVLNLADGWARVQKTWEDALRKLRMAMEDVGILVVINGVVSNNTHRKLDVSEFRGFVLCDDYAPLVFVNGADGKAAQMFTLAHELAHVWVGGEGVFSLEALQPAEDDKERFCNRVAAEFLVPAQDLKKIWLEMEHTSNPFQISSIVAKRFKVSPLVAARRALDLGMLTKQSFFEFYRQYSEKEYKEKEYSKTEEGGGNFYLTQGVRIGKRFACAVIRAVKEGRLLYRDAYQLTDLHGKSFDEYAKKLGFIN